MATTVLRCGNEQLPSLSTDGDGGKVHGGGVLCGWWEMVGGAVTPASRHSCPNLALSIFLNFKILSVSDFHFKFSFQIIVKYILISKFNLKLR